jgi:hypothetical protein
MTPIVCWDFDETIGYFRPWEFRYLGQPVPENMPPPRLKPGIHDLLRSLREFTHVVTTGANGEYARFVLKEYDLLDFFDGVIGREEGIFREEGKDYKVVGECYGLKELELARCLIIVGNDSERDPDLHFRHVVTIFDNRMVDQPASPLGIVLRQLVLEGKGGMKAGFDVLFERAKTNDADDPHLIESGVRFGVDYWGSYVEEKLHPMIVRPRYV